VELTKLERYLKSRGIKPAHRARESGYSRQHLLRVRIRRMGRPENASQHRRRIASTDAGAGRSPQCIRSRRL